MKPFLLHSLLILVLFFAVPFAAATDDAARLAGLDRFWNAVSQSVKDGDFEGYKANLPSGGHPCHRKVENLPAIGHGPRTVEAGI